MKNMLLTEQAGGRRIRGQVNARIHKGRRRTGERGSALIEFSLVLMLLLYLILGGFSYGVILAHRQVMQQAAGEATRVGMLASSAQASDAQARTLAVSKTKAILGTTACDPGSGITCTVTVAPCAGEATARCLSVEIVHDRSIDPIVARLPFLESVMPTSLTADSTARVT